MKNEFLNYAVGMEARPRHSNEGQYVVTAEFTGGYEILSYHDTKVDAVAAMKRYQAADARRKKGAT